MTSSSGTQKEKDLRRDRIHTLWSDITTASDSKSLMSDMRELYKLHLMSRGDTSFSDEMAQDRALWGSMIGHYLAGKQSLNPGGIHLSASQVQPLMLMDEHEAYRFGRFSEAREKVAQYAPYITSPQGKLMNMTDDMNLLEQQGSYQQALAMLDQVEQEEETMGVPQKQVTERYAIARYEMQQAMKPGDPEIAVSSGMSGKSGADALMASSKPSVTTLRPNYPNPFNPTTTIRYELAGPVNVRLTIYNVLGQRVAMLVDSRQMAGWHQAIFNALNLSSGLYFYRLQAGNKILVKKMLLLK